MWKKNLKFPKSHPETLHLMQTDLHQEETRIKYSNPSLHLNQSQRERSLSLCLYNQMKNQSNNKNIKMKTWIRMKSGWKKLNRKKKKYSSIRRKRGLKTHNSKLILKNQILGNMFIIKETKDLKKCIKMTFKTSIFRKVKSKPLRDMSLNLQDMSLTLQDMNLSLQDMNQVIWLHTMMKKNQHFSCLWTNEIWKNLR